VSQRELAEISECHEQMIERLVGWIVDKELVVLAILLLEAYKPLAPIGGQALLFLQPFFGLIGPMLNSSGGEQGLDDRLSEWAMLLQEPGAIDRVLVRLEHQETA
jgi:hypothetical protein